MCVCVYYYYDLHLPRHLEQRVRDAVADDASRLTHSVVPFRCPATFLTCFGVSHDSTPPSPFVARVRF